MIKRTWNLNMLREISVFFHFQDCVGCKFVNNIEKLRESEWGITIQLRWDRREVHRLAWTWFAWWNAWEIGSNHWRGTSMRVSRRRRRRRIRASCCVRRGEGNRITEAPEPPAAVVAVLPLSETTSTLRRWWWRFFVVKGFGKLGIVRKWRWWVNSAESVFSSSSSSTIWIGGGRAIIAASRASSRDAFNFHVYLPHYPTSIYLFFLFDPLQFTLDSKSVFKWADRSI